MFRPSRSVCTAGFFPSRPRSRRADGALGAPQQLACGFSSSVVNNAGYMVELNGFETIPRSHGFCFSLNVYIESTARVRRSRKRKDFWPHNVEALRRDRHVGRSQAPTETPQRMSEP